MSAVRVVVTILLGTTCALTTLAQPPRGRDSFFRALRDVHRQNPDNELLEFALHPDLPKLLEIEKREIEPFCEAMNELRSEIDKIHRDHKSAPMEHDELVSKMLKVSSAGREQAIEAFKKSGKWERLIGLFVQLRGSTAAATGIVAEKISLSEDQLKQFRKTRSELWDKHMDEVREAIQSAMRNRDRDPNRGQRFAKMMQEAQKKLNVKLRELLTSEQQTALDQLRGEEIPNLAEKLDPRKRPPGGRGRPQRGENFKKPNNRP